MTHEQSTEWQGTFKVRNHGSPFHSENVIGHFYIKLWSSQTFPGRDGRNAIKVRISTTCTTSTYIIYYIHVHIHVNVNINVHAFPLFCHIWRSIIKVDNNTKEPHLLCMQAIFNLLNTHTWCTLHVFFASSTPTGIQTKTFARDMWL